MTTPAPLSPAAQKILKAFREKTGVYQDVLPDERCGLAAVIRVAADHVVPDEPDYMRAAIADSGWWDAHDLIRFNLLAIAAELDPTTEAP